MSRSRKRLRKKLLPHAWGDIFLLHRDDITDSPRGTPCGGGNPLLVQVEIFRNRKHRDLAFYGRERKHNKAIAYYSRFSRPVGGKIGRMALLRDTPPDIIAHEAMHVTMHAEQLMVDNGDEFREERAATRLQRIFGDVNDFVRLESRRGGRE